MRGLILCAVAVLLEATAAQAGYTSFNLSPSGGQAVEYPMYSTRVYGIDGNNIVGSYRVYGGRDHGFLYDGTTYTTLDVPGARWTEAHRIDGNNIVGTYRDAAGDRHDFLYDGTTYTTLFILDDLGVNDIDGNTIVGSVYGDSYGMDFGFLYTIPEPSTFLMSLIFGAISICVTRWRRRK